MRRNVSGYSSYVIGLQNINSGLPTCMKFSCLSFISSSGIFKQNKLIAAGTKHGQIVLFDVKDNAISYASLLCGHSIKVTDLIQNEKNTFFSISMDSTLCVWSIKDGICISTHKILNIYADYHLSPTFDNNPNYIWIWSNNTPILLVDVMSGSIIKEYMIPGKLSFSQSKENPNQLLVAAINSYNVYEMIEIQPTMQKSSSFISPSASSPSLSQLGAPVNALDRILHIKSQFDFGEMRLASPFGFVKFKNKRLTFLNKKYETIGSMVIGQLQIDEKMSGVQWYDENMAVVIFESGVLYHVKFNKEENTFSAQRFFETENMIYRFSFHKDNGFAFIDSKFMVVYVNSSKQEIRSQRKPQTNFYEVPDHQKPTIIQTNGKNKFEMFNWTVSSMKSAPFINNSKITAISSRYIQSHGLQIITGSETGVVSFFWAEKQTPTSEAIALNSPIVAFVKFSLTNAGRDLLIALGEDGSCAIFKFVEVIQLYPSTGMSILNVHVLKNQELIIITRADFSVSVYSLNDIEPVTLLTQVPEGAEEIYPALYKHIQLKNVATLDLSFGKSDFYYSAISLTGTAQLNDTIMMKNNFAQQYSMFLSMLQPIDKSKSMESLKDMFQTDFDAIASSTSLLNCDTDKLDLSFVLIGDQNVPTFFYPLYTISGLNIYDSSPYISALHFLGSRILGKLLHHSKSTIKIVESNFVEAMVRFMESSDQMIQHFAARSCANAPNTIRMPKAQEIMEQFKDITTLDYLDASDIILISIVYVKDPNLVPQQFHKKLLSILLKLSLESTPIASLALIIIIDGYNYWANVCGSKMSLMNSICARMLTYQRPQHVVTTFAICASNDDQSFFRVLAQFIHDEETDLSPELFITRLFSLTTSVAFANKHVIGSMASLFIAKVGNDSPRLRKIVNEELKKHAQSFPTVAMQKKFLLIGTNDGYVTLFKDGSLSYTKKIFSTPVTRVYIGPQEIACCAVSRDEKKAVVFTTKYSGILQKHPKILQTLESGPQILWTSPTECKFVE